MTPQTVTFLCGFGGSLAGEIVLLNQFMQAGSGKLPGRYQKPLFWVVRILLAVLGGGLALAYEIHSPLLAANIGAATPLIIKAFSQGISPLAAPSQSPVAQGQKAVHFLLKEN